MLEPQHWRPAEEPARRGSRHDGRSEALTGATARATDRRGMPRTRPRPGSEGPADPAPADEDLPTAPPGLAGDRRRCRPGAGRGAAAGRAGPRRDGRCLPELQQQLPPGDRRRRGGRRGDGRPFRRFRVHGLRHGFAIRALKAGWNIYALSRHLGHSSVKTTARYLAYPTKDERARVAQTGTRILARHAEGSAGFPAPNGFQVADLKG